jgi:nucleoside-diphosphate-sugar epimerase
VLLTGATGLLGQYLLRGLLAAGQPVVVLARPCRGRAAADRVAECVAFWGEALGRPLACPAVLEADLGPRLAGVTPADRRWLGRRCRAVVHAAASLAFRPAPDGEPWRTNVEGTAALLRLCREVGIAEWHHVSTAFVCGRRAGPIHEGELDCGQDFHNHYEQSKLEAERRVRAAAGLRVTVYRPSVIVGDSRTGHTSSYGGLYRLLGLAARLADACAPSVGGRAPGPRPFPLRLPLSGAEPSNLVPVDWVAAAVVGLLARPEAHGATYHIVGRSPVPAGLVCRVAAEELGLEGVELVGPGGVTRPSALEEAFREGLEDYWPYLAGAPEFRCDNTARALPDLPPPPVDVSLLRRLIRFAVSDNWGRGRPPQPAPRPVSPCADYIECIFPRQARRSHLARAARLSVVVAFDIRGPGGGQWSCRWAEGELTGVTRGLDPGADVTYRTDPAAFEEIVRGRQTPQQAFFDRRVAITGDMEKGVKLAALFGRFLAENPHPGRPEAPHDLSA